MKTLPLRFEVDRNREATIAAVLDGLGVHEREFLIAHPECLGVRCEAFLAHQAPEWFDYHGYLSDEDRELLGRLCRAA